MKRMMVLILLAGCSSPPAVVWPSGSANVAPVLVPLAEILQAPPDTAEARGAALAAEAAALKARTASIPTR